MNDVLAERALAEAGAWKGKPGADGLEVVA
jgi:hypothetical protein